MEDSAQIEHAIVNSHAPAIIENAASIARRSNRVLQVAQQEVDNSEDPLLQLEVTNASNNLKGGKTTISFHQYSSWQNNLDRYGEDAVRQANTSIMRKV